MNPIADQIVAYRVPEGDARAEEEAEAYGLCLRREGNALRVMLLQREDNREEPLRLVLRKISDEDVVVSSLENRFQSLQSKLSEEHKAGGQSRSCRVQETMLQWAVRRLEGTEEKEWEALSRQRRPSAVTAAVACTVASIAAGGALVSSTWVEAQVLLRSGKDVVQRLRRLGERPMERSLYDSVEETYLSDPPVSYASVSQEPPLLGALHKWITALMDFQRARYMEDEKAELQQQITGCQCSLQSARERRGSLAEQAELINKGNCYSRTQTVRSIPVQQLLYLVTAEKVTTRQYLLKERAPLELLEEALAKSFTSPRSARQGRDDEQAMAAASASTPAGRRSAAETSVVETAQRAAVPRAAPSAEPTRLGAWVNGHYVRRPGLPVACNDGRDCGVGCASAAASPPIGTLPTVATTAPALTSQEKERHPHSNRTLSSGGAVGGVSAAVAVPLAIRRDAGTAPPSSLPWVHAGKQNGAPAQSLAPSVLSSPDDAHHVLADVKNHFTSVQETLLACFAEYEQLEHKYAHTVEQSRQLLQTLEERDGEIARLRADLSRAAAASFLTRHGSASPQTPRRRGGVNGGQNGDLSNGHGRRTESVPCRRASDTAAPVDSLAQRIACLLDDTLDFVRGAAAAPVM
ncbi:hypothetical protein NESM_000623800 [Novymonas esmeraldas]|uniref:Uncharacterized protein n=1 Tax=Novymonas esmeraldas TaxID=1808958 RepID=A0AAW0EV33_9TRYP